MSERTSLSAGRRVRVAVVQLAYHPAFKDTLADPLFSLDRPTSSLLPDGLQAAPEAIRSKFNELRRRIRATYVEHIRRRVEAILEACKAWKVDLIVFPEYSIPPDILESLAHVAGQMVIVAGSHYVDRATIRGHIYERLGGRPSPDLLEQSVSPVIHEGKLRALVPKLHAAKPEVGTLRLGMEWDPVPLPESIPGPMAVLICLDFISRQSSQHLDYVARPLGNCRFIAAPALTNTHSLPEFNSQALKDARREHRPVLFANYALGGGSTIIVDEGRETDTSLFPEHTGRLEPNEEGVIVADLDLGVDRVGLSTSYVLIPSVTPVAAASLVYRGIEQEYSGWLDALQTKLVAPDHTDYQRLEDIAALVLQTPPPTPNHKSARKRRLDRLAQDIEDESSLLRVKQLSTELILAENILPLNELRAALARGAADEVTQWVNELGVSEFASVATRLSEPWEKLAHSMKTWSSQARTALENIRASVRGGPAPHDPKKLIGLVDLYEKEIERGFEEEDKKASALSRQGRYAEARDIYKAMQTRAEDMVRRGENEARAKLRQWSARCKLQVALSTLKLQEHEAAREILSSISPEDLSTSGKIHLAEGLALVGERIRARDILPAEETISESDRLKLVETQQTLDLLEGRLPTSLVDTAPIRLRAATMLLTKHDLATAAQLALEAIERSEGIALTNSIATLILTEVLWRTILELPPNAIPIPVGNRPPVIEALETQFGKLLTEELPTAIRESLSKAEERFRVLIKDIDWLTDHFEAPDSEDDQEDSLRSENPRSLAWKLARDGRIEEALQSIPADPDNHPWRTRFDRIELLAFCNEFSRALAEALALALAIPDKAPIEYMAAKLLAHDRRIPEAIAHAEKAFTQLPGCGHRLLLANQRLELDDAEGAWDLLKDLESDDRPRVLRARALAAEEANRFDDADKAWRRYLERVPNDGLARIRFAQLLFRMHKLEEAAAVAWRMFQEQGEQLSLDALHGCGSLQRLAGPLDIEQTRRIKEIAARIKERFPTDARAEHLRFQLIATLGEIPGDVPPIDIPKLVEAGYLRRAKEGLPALVEFFNQRTARLTAIDQLRRNGAIPTAVACTMGNARLALAVTRILERSRHASGLLCPPVSLVDHLPEIDFKGATLLASDLELLLLELLDIIPLLRATLGTTGQLVLFQHAHDRIVDDAAYLRIHARPDRLSEVENLLRRLEHRPTIAPDPSAPNDDAAAARKAGVVLVDYEKRADADIISARAFIHYLSEQRIIDDEQRANIEIHLPPETDPLPHQFETFPERIAVSWFFVEALFKAGALDAVFDAYHERLSLGPTVARYFRRERDELVDAIKAHELADRVHARLAEGWIHVRPEPTVKDLPPLRDPTKDWAEELVLNPLQEMLTYRHAVIEHPAWWRLTADFFGSNVLGAPGLTEQLAWTSRNEYLDLIERLRPAQERDLALPTLVRLLIQNLREADQRLLKLAELGFPDALDAAAILRLERRYKGLEKGEPKRILDQQEWMAREVGHLGGDLARLRLAETYAEAVFACFATTDRTDAEKKSLLDTMMCRQEAIGASTRTNALDQAFAFIALSTLGHWTTAWVVQEGKATLDTNSHIAVLWSALSAWSSTNSSRRAAQGRALREAWRVLAHQSGEPSLGLALTLMLAHWGDTKKVPSQLEPALEAATIISSLWKESPFAEAGYGHLLVSAAELLAKEPDSVCEPRQVSYPVLFSETSATALIQLPIEALFLRLQSADKRNVVSHLKLAQGPYDGIAYNLLEEIGKTPEDVKLLRQYAEHASTALFRLIQDDPLFLRTWVQARRLGYDGNLSKLDELRAVLSEPNALLPAGQPLHTILDERVAPTSGCWSQRVDRITLLTMASEIPGSLPAFTTPIYLQDESFSEHVRVALHRLEHPEEHPIAQLARDMFFLRAAAMLRPPIKLPEGELNLYEILPMRLLRLLESVSAPPPADSMASVEAALLRVCAEIIQRISSHERLPVRDGLWLTYRLFQWLCLQLDALPPDERRNNMRQLAANAPQTGSPQDLLDPVGFGHGLFDYRLATVLHTLGAMEELAAAMRSRKQEQSLDEPKRISSPELESKLLAFAEHAHTGPHYTSVLDWKAPCNVPDLALYALFRLNSSRFADLSTGSRMRRFEALPVDPQSLKNNDEAMFDLAGRIVLATADIIGDLTPNERTFLESKFRSMDDSPISRCWRWVIFTMLFSKGMHHLEEDAFKLTLEHTGHTLAPIVLGYLLAGIAAQTPARVESTVDAILAGAAQQLKDPLTLVFGALGRVYLRGHPTEQDFIGPLILRLAERPIFQSDPRLSEVLIFFGLSKPV